MREILDKIKWLPSDVVMTTLVLVYGGTIGPLPGLVHVSEGRGSVVHGVKVR